MSDDQSVNLKQSLSKFKIGDHVSDVELDKLIEHFDALDASLRISGELYRLVWRDNFDNLERALGYKKSREEK